MEKNKIYHLIVPVWGDSFTSLFADICLPMLMTPGNLDAFLGEKGHTFVICTTIKDAKYLADHPSILLLREYIEVEFIFIDGIVCDLNLSHMAMSECYSLAIQSPKIIPGETYFIFLTPDSFWSSNTFRRLKEVANDGYEVAMAMGLRTKRESIEPNLNNILNNRQKKSELSSETLVTLALQNIHQMSSAHEWSLGKRFLNIWPSHIYWMGKNFIVARCFHMHPIMVKSKIGSMLIGDTIDGKFLANLRYPFSKYYISRGSDDFFGIELSPKKRNWGQSLYEPTIGSVIKFGVMHASKLHWDLFKHSIVLKGVGLKSDDLILKSALDISNKVFNRVYRFYPLALIVESFRLRYLMRWLISTRFGKFIKSKII
jgi:hypothetical protein